MARENLVAGLTAAGVSIALLLVLGPAWRRGGESARAPLATGYPDAAGPTSAANGTDLRLEVHQLRKQLQQLAAHIVNMLEPSTVVDGIYQDGVSLSENRYPSGPGEPQDCEAARRDARSTMGNDQPGEIVSPKSGYLTVVDLGHLVSCLQHGDAFVKQAVPVGTYVLPGQVLAEVWARGENREELHGRVLEAFELGKQRTLVQDTAFCVRQLADVALKGLSPGINDPTTSENAMDAMASLLVTFIKSETPCEIRVDDEGVPRFLALAPDLNDLVKLGFDQVVVAAKGSPVVISRLLQLLEHIETQARANGVRCGETDRQRRALRRE